MKHAKIAVVLVFLLLASGSLFAQVPSATVSTSLDQCESQTCGGSNPHLASYDGPLSGFPGTQTVGEGAFVTVSASPFPTLTSEVPTAGANAAIAAELEYYIEVVPINGNLTQTPVLLGVSAIGSDTVTTTGGPGASNNANALLELQLQSNESGTDVFNDSVSLIYSAGNSASCSTSNTSSVIGAGVLGAASVACSGSNASGRFTESGSYTIDSNAIYGVVMNANLTVGTSNDGLAQGGGTVQGIISLDPTFSVPAGYTLELSPGVGNSPSATPEPATWTMLSAGLGFLILAMQRRVNRTIRLVA